MTAGREIGGLLAGQLESLEADMRRLAEPYKQAAEYRRRVEIAAAFVADQGCSCERIDGTNDYTECPWHYLTRVLAGDE